MRKITLVELFTEYERTLAAYMKLNGKYVVIPPDSGEKAMMINDLRGRVQNFRNEVFTRAAEADKLGELQ